MLAHIISTRCPTGVTEDGEDVTELSIGTSANGFILKTVLHAAYDEFTGALLHVCAYILFPTIGQSHLVQRRLPITSSNVMISARAFGPCGAIVALCRASV